MGEERSSGGSGNAPLCTSWDLPGSPYNHCGRKTLGTRDQTLLGSVVWKGVLSVARPLTVARGGIKTLLS